MYSARRPSPVARSILYPYPPNARQLIAAGLTGRPSAGSLADPVAVDMALVDGTETTILYHVTRPVDPATASRRMSLAPFIILRDDRGHVYQPRQGGMMGGPIYYGSGWRGIVGGLLSLFRRADPAWGFVSYASLPSSAHAALLTVYYAGQTERVRVPLRLAALRTAVITVAPHRVVAGSGVTVRLTRVSRAPGVGALSYTVTTPAIAGGGMPMPRDTLSDNRGRSIMWSGGSGSCGMPTTRPARMTCAESWTFASPPRGTRLTLTVALLNPSGRGALPGGPWRVSFTMP